MILFFPFFVKISYRKYAGFFIQQKKEPSFGSFFRITEWLPPSQKQAWPLRQQRHRQPSQMCLFSFSFSSSVFVYLTQDSRKKQQKGARLTPGSKFLRHVS